MQGGYTQTGSHKERQRCSRVVKINLIVVHVPLLLHDSAQGQPDIAASIPIAGKTKQAADHRSVFILGASPKPRRSIIGPIQNALLELVIFFQPLEDKFRLQGAKQLECQGKTLQYRCLDLFREAAMTAAFRATKPGPRGKSSHRFIQNPVHLQNLKLQFLQHKNITTN